MEIRALPADKKDTSIAWQCTIGYRCLIDNEYQSDTGEGGLAGGRQKDLSGLCPAQCEPVPSGVAHPDAVPLRYLRGTKKFFSRLLAKKERRPAIGGESL